MAARYVATINVWLLECPKKVSKYGDFSIKILPPKMLSVNDITLLLVSDFFFVLKIMIYCMYFKGRKEYRAYKVLC
jgi:hypothetical protein